MVGVPGRSKGCNTCIRRKIKCDQGVPSCGNCLKSRLSCAGYTRKRGYVFSQDVATPAHIQVLNLGESAVTHQGRWRAVEKIRGSSDALISAQVNITWPSSGDTSPPLSPRLSNSTPHRQQLHYIFLNSYMPSESTKFKEPRFEITGNWLVQLQNETIDSPALEASIAAYATAQIGRTNNDTAVVRNSREIYNRSLEQLRLALSKPETRLSDETLAACMALSVYELSESGSGGSAYHTHLMGAMVLLKTRGPNANNTPLAHSLFLGFRRQALIGNVRNHHEFLFADAQWREAPWSVFPKSFLDACFDVLFDIPIVDRRLNELDFETDTVKAFTHCNEVIETCRSADSKLRDWYGELAKSSTGPLYWPTFSILESSLDDSDGGKLFPTSNQFSSVSFAYMLATYWSAVMAVNHLLMRAYQRLATVESCNTTLAKKYRETWIENMNNICQTTEYLLQDAAGRMGPSVALSVLSACRSCANDDAELEQQRIWITTMLGSIAKRLNWGMKGALWSSLEYDNKS